MRIIKFIAYSLVFFPSSLFLIAFAFISLKNSHIPLEDYLKRPAVAQASEPAQIIPEVTPIVTLKEDVIDKRIFTLQTFFSNLSSPLVDYADILVSAADKYELDYRLIPAISMQESSACKKIPKDSYNCWGFGIYGNKIATFDSYEMAIEKVAKTLKEQYKDQGLTNATLVEDKWNPNSDGSWSYGVNFYLGQIRQTETSLK